MSSSPPLNNKTSGLIIPNQLGPVHHLWTDRYPDLIPSLVGILIYHIHYTSEEMNHFLSLIGPIMSTLPLNRLNQVYPHGVLPPSLALSGVNSCGVLSPPALSRARTIKLRIGFQTTTLLLSSKKKKKRERAKNRNVKRKNHFRKRILLILRKCLHAISFMHTFSDLLPKKLLRAVWPLQLQWWPDLVSLLLRPRPTSWVDPELLASLMSALIFSPRGSHSSWSGFSIWQYQLSALAQVEPISLMLSLSPT